MVSNITDELKQKNEDQVIFEQTCEIIIQEVDIERRELTELIKTTTKEKSHSKDVIEARDARKKECMNLKTAKADEIKVSKSILTEIRKNITNEKAKLKKMRAGRKLDQDGFDVELDGLLKTYGKIYQTAYHGGDLNGVCCLRLVENQQEIIEKIREMCERRRNQRTNGQPCSVDKLDDKLTLYS